MPCHFDSHNESHFDSRFAGCSPRASWAVFIVLALAMVASLLLTPHTQPKPAAIHVLPVPSVAAAPVAGPAAAMSDIILYQRITAAVANGESYYKAAAHHHRQNDFPLKPYVTVRPPTLAWLSAALGPQGTRLAMFALIGAVVMAWLGVLRNAVPSLLVRYAAFALLAESVLILGLNPFIHFHESWAALLIALALALRADRPALAITAGLLAVLLRELALPFLLIMAAAAALERRWPEVTGWALAVGLAAVAQLLHARAVAAVLLPADLSSQGWTGMGGWPFFLAATRNASLLELSPAWVAAIVLPLSVFGWLSWRSAIALRVTALLLCYALLLMGFARKDNIYWAVLIEPFLLAGLSFAAASLLQLARGVTYARKSSIRVSSASPLSSRQVSVTAPASHVR
jgi:hypothetical protein